MSISPTSCATTPALPTTAPTVSAGGPVTPTPLAQTQSQVIAEQSQVITAQQQVISAQQQIIAAQPQSTSAVQPSVAAGGPAVIMAPQPAVAAQPVTAAQPTAAGQPVIASVPGVVIAGGPTATQPQSNASVAPPVVYTQAPAVSAADQGVQLVVPPLDTTIAGGGPTDVATAVANAQAMVQQATALIAQLQGAGAGAGASAGSTAGGGAGAGSGTGGMAGCSMGADMAGCGGSSGSSSDAAAGADATKPKAGKKKKSKKSKSASKTKSKGGGSASGTPPTSSTVGQLPPLPPGSSAAQMRQRIVDLAKHELSLGVKEDRDNNDSAGNIDRYRSAVTGKGNKNDEWCGDFASYITQQAGVPIGANGSGEIEGKALRSWAEGAGKWFSPKSHDPQPGDLIMFEWKTGGHHVGVVDHVANGKVYTIEGNSSRSVKANSYSLTNPVIWGYVNTVG